MSIPQTFGVRLMKTRNPNQNAPIAGATTRISVNGMRWTSAMYAAPAPQSTASTANTNTFPPLPPSGRIGVNGEREARRWYIGGGVGLLIGA
jgi:hypothetical protein